MKKSYFVYVLAVVCCFFGIIFMSSCNKDVENKTNVSTTEKETSTEQSSEEDKYKVIFDSNGGTEVRSQTVKKGEKAVKPSNPEKEGYTFDNWYYENEVWSFIGYSITENITLTAHWIINEYELVLSKNDNNAGNVRGNGKFEYDSNVTITATTNPGYTFVGWYNNSNKISDKLTYSFKMPANKLMIEARWIKVNIGVNDVNAGRVSGINSTYLVGDEVTITATTNPGYTFVGWYDENKLLSSNNSYTFIMPDKNQNYEARWSKIELKINDVNAGTITNLTGKYLVGDEITITATTNPGYTFVGWFYNSSTKVSDGLTYTFNATAENVIYEARWIKVSFSYNNPFGGTSVVLDGTYMVGDEVTVYANVNPGYNFDGWSLKGELISETTKLTFIMPDENIIYYALYSQAEYSLTVVNHSTEVTIDSTIYNGKYKYRDKINISVSNNSEMQTLWMIDNEPVFIGNNYNFSMLPNDTTIDIYSKNVYSRNLNTIYMGSYPQTLVEDENITDMLNSKILGVPDSQNVYNWSTYDYYIENEIKQFMYYIDLDIDDDGMNDYRGVYFTQYRPTVTSGKDNSQQDDNEYLVNKLYWFKYEPIEWDILEEDDGKMIIISHLVLDAQSYYWSASKGVRVHTENPLAAANNYIYSDIRRFLNEDFYTSVFNVYEKLIIQTTIVDNGTAPDSISTSCYASTNDKIYLLSSKEVNKYYSTKEEALTTGTDYALCQGLTVFKGYSDWWLRQADGTIYSSVVMDTGVFSMIQVDYTIYGVRMALCITK